MAGLRKRILFVAHSGSPGGAEICLDTLLRHLEPAKYDVTVLFPWDGPMVESARGLGYKVELEPFIWWMCFPPSLWYYKRLGLGVLPTVARLASYIRRRRIDLVYSNSAFIFEPALAARLAGVPHVWHVHEVLDRGYVERPVLPLRWIIGLIDRLSDRVIFESHASKNVYARVGSEKKCVVVHNSLRFGDEPVPEADGPARQRLGLGPDDLAVAFVGQFTERKNPLLLLRAAWRLRDPRLKFLFVGDGPLRGDLANAARALGLEDRCRLVPFERDVRWVLRAIDALVLPSRQESFGLVLVEAGNYGKPVIAARVDGPKEIVVDGETGLLFESDNEADLAAKIEDLFSGRIDRRRMGEAGRRRAREQFSARDNARKIESVIDQLVQGA
jgi:glycosyltransferase involved in cell wall biosynthesis